MVSPANGKKYYASFDSFAVFDANLGIEQPAGLSSEVFVQVCFERRMLIRGGGGPPLNMEKRKCESGYFPPPASLPMSVNSGRYIAITIVPIVTPRNKIIAGSIRLSKFAIAASTSCS